MAMAVNSCTCGCSSMTSLTSAEEQCGCGCECCAQATKTRDEEIAELTNLRHAIEKRLAELEPESAGA